MTYRPNPLDDTLDITTVSLSHLSQIALQLSAATWLVLSIAEPLIRQLGIDGISGNLMQLLAFVIAGLIGAALIHGVNRLTLFVRDRKART